MSTDEISNKWINLRAPRIIHHMTVPTGVERDNYVIIDRDFNSNIIRYIYKYNINNDKWVKMDCIKNLNLKNVAEFSGSAALDVNKQILYLLHNEVITQICLKNGNVNNYKHNTYIHCSSTTTIILLEGSLFAVGGTDSSSIWKWDIEKKTLVKFSHMYDKIVLDDFGIVYNQKRNSILLFGGTHWKRGESHRVDYILEFNINNKQWNKLNVSLPEKIGYLCCTMAIYNRYVLIFGGRYDDDRYTGEIFHSDNIYVYSIEHKTITKSKIKCPSEGIFKAITINDHSKDEK
eukprot:542574_1